MGNLQQQGYRLMVHDTEERAEWMPPAIATVMAGDGWTDCTDMDDAQIRAHLTAREQVAA